MRENWPSLTALYVTYARAVAARDAVLSRACDDRFAEQLLPEALRALLRRSGAGAGGRLLGAALQASTFGLSHHLALRTALIDRALEHALETGIDQVVLLGAGFDARAHRMAPLGAATVFEVDHPATQRAKRARAGSLPVAAGTLRYVECDFERRALEDTLLAAGFDRARRAVWVWEGVTMYLRAAGVVQTLRSIASLSQASSLLIATYLTPDIVLGGRPLGRLSGRALGLISEPIRFVTAPPELLELLAAHGFSVLSDALPKDAAPHFGVVLGGLAPLLPAERLVVAIKGGTQS
jgi:methyltransferase (TIGR00027 family)